MAFRVLTLLFVSIFANSTIADLKPDALECDAKKAARNAAMDATVGISGRCDTSKAAKNAKDNVADDVKDSVDIDIDEKRRNGDSVRKERDLKRKED